MFDAAFIVRPASPASPATARPFAVARGLRDMGFRVTVCSQSDFEASPEGFATAQAVVFHRPAFTEALARHLSRRAASGGPPRLIADYDALTFDIRSAPGPGIGDDTEPQRQDAAAEAEIGSMFEVRTAATVSLAAAAREIMGGETLAVPDILDRGRVDMARCMRRTAPADRSGAAWLPVGGGDAALPMALEKGLHGYLAQSPQRRLFIPPGCPVPSGLSRFQDRILPLEGTSFEKRAAVLSGCAVALCSGWGDPPHAGSMPILEIAALGTVVAIAPGSDLSGMESPLVRPCATAADFAAALDYDPGTADRELAAEKLCRTAGLESRGREWLRILHMEP